MITLEQFTEFIKSVEAHHEKTDALHKLGIDVLDAFPEFEKLEELFIDTNLTQDGADWYYWFMYEDLPQDKDKAWDESGEVIPMETIEDLWNYLVKNNYLR